MLTLKIKWERLEDGKVADQESLFIPADRISVHGETKSLETMSAWDPNEFHNYSTVNDKTDEILPSRLIEVIKDEVSSWYLASQAWILGPNGSTIERVAP